jgi:hypothetical protein
MEFPVPQTVAQMANIALLTATWLFSVPEFVLPVVISGGMEVASFFGE